MYLDPWRLCLSPTRVILALIFITRLAPLLSPGSNSHLQSFARSDSARSVFFGTVNSRSFYPPLSVIRTPTLAFKLAFFAA